MATVMYMASFPANETAPTGSPTITTSSSEPTWYHCGNDECTSHDVILDLVDGEVIARCQCGFEIRAPVESIKRILEAIA